MNNLLARIPLVRFLIPFVIGIVFSYLFKIQIGIPGFVFVIFSIVLLLIFQRKLLQHSLKYVGLDGVIISFAFLFLGIGCTSINSNNNNLNLVDCSKKTNALQVQLLSNAIVKEKSVKLAVEVISWRDSLTWKRSNEKMLVYLKREPGSEKLKYGDVVLICASPTAIEGPQNPEEFDYRKWLDRQGIHAQVYAVRDEWKIISRENGNWFKAAALDLRSYFFNKLQSYGMSGTSFGVAAALLLGASDQLDPGTIQSYAASGTLHVLSVSGMHVALVYVVLLKLLLPFEKRRWGKWMSIFLQLTFLWFYATLTGLCPSVMRSVTMLSVVIAGRAFNRNAHLLNSLAASAFILLIIDPMLLFDIGFQLSYLAVVGIVMLQPKLESIWEPNQNTFHGKVLSHLWTLISVTVVAQIFTFPLGLYYFNQFPTYFLLSNLVVIPLSTIVMYAGLFLLIISPLKIIAVPFAHVFQFLVDLLNECVASVEHLPYAVLTSAKWGFLELVLIYLGIGLLIFYLLKRYNLLLHLGLAVFFLLIVSVGCGVRKKLQNREIVIFNLKHASGIVVINGADHVLFADTTLLKRKGEIDFHILPLLKASGMELDKICSLQDTGIFKNNFVHQGRNFMMACGKKIAIVGRNFNANTYTTCDILLLKDNANVNLSDLLLLMKPTLVVVDGSDSKWKIQKWLACCKTSAIDFYDITKHGALIITP